MTMTTMMRELTQVLALTGVWMIGGFCISLVMAMWKIYRNVPAKEVNEFITCCRRHLGLGNGNGNVTIWKKIDYGFTNLMLWPRTMYLILSSIDEALADWNRNRSL